MPETLILIPAYNEAAHIQAVVRAAAAHLPVLVVDDGSRDACAALAEAAGAQVIRQVPNQGKGAALRAGFLRALEQGAQAVITLDADGQHDPLEIPRFLTEYQSSRADLIIGERDFRQMPFSRRLANTLGKRAFSWALGREVRDNQSGYRLISARLMRAMLDSQEGGFEFEVEMVVRAALDGMLIRGVPIRTIYADEVSHIRPVQHVRNFLQMVMKTRRRMRQAAGGQNG